jgi:serine O-acetyltransferase
MKQLTPWECFNADRKRYPRNALLVDRSLWAIAVYRFGQAVLSTPRFAQYFLYPFYRLMMVISQILTNIEICKRAQIGPGLRIYHAGPIVINDDVTIGAECTLRVGNILGNRVDDKCPALGDRVTLGAGAQILGDVTVGDDVIIGAMSLVISDVPSKSIVAGVPARIVRRA